LMSLIIGLFWQGDQFDLVRPLLVGFPILRLF
jgi:hypothetical protein